MEIDGQTYGRTDGLTNKGLMGEGTDGEIDGQIDGRTDNGLTEGRTNGQGRTNAWTGRPSEERAGRLAATGVCGIP